MPFIKHKYPTFKDYLKNLLIERNETASSLSRYIGVSRSYISQILCGKVQVSRLQVETIMNALCRNPSDFFNTLPKDK